jgi:hypothetical protein
VLIYGSFNNESETKELRQKGLTERLDAKQWFKEQRPCGKTTSFGDIILQTRFDHFFESTAKTHY